METARDARASVFFDRAPHGGYKITARDLSVLARLERRRVMDSTHLLPLEGHHYTYVKFTRLYHHGYVERLDCYRRERLPKGGGSKPIPFAITNKTKKLLREKEIDLSAPTRDWAERNRLLKASSVPHFLATATVDTQYHLADRECPDVGLQEAAQSVSLLAPGRESAIVPDLTYIGERNGSGRFVLFNEIDMGTEPNDRHGASSLQSLRSKFAGYLAYTRSGLPQYEFGTKACRVLTIVASGKKKQENVAHTAFSVCGGVGVDRFLVATLDDIKNHGLLAPVWINAAGEERGLA